MGKTAIQVIYSLFVITVAFFLISLELDILQYLFLVILLTLIPLVFIKPVWGLVLLIISRNLIDAFDKGIVLSMGPIGFNLASIIGILVLPWAVLIIVQQINQQGYSFKEFITLPLVRPWLVFICISILSLLVTQNMAGSLTVLIKLGDYFAMYLLGFLLQKKIGFKKYLYIVASALAIPSLFGIYQLLTNASLFTRISGTYAHSNAFAFSLMIALGVLITILVANNTAHKHFWAFMAVVYSFLLLFTFTRSAWLAITIIIVFWLLFYFRKSLLVLSFIAILLVLSYPVLVGQLGYSQNATLSQNPIIQRLQPETEDDAGSLKWRIRTWNETLPAVWESPIIGYGIGSYSDIRLNYISYESDLNSLEAHNDYLRLGVEVGIAGVLAYLLLYLTIIKNIIKAYRSNPVFKKIAIGCLALTVALIIISFADNVLRNAPVQWMYWSLIGVFMGTIHKYELSNRNN